MRHIFSILAVAIVAFAISHGSTGLAGPKQQPAPPPAPEPVKQLQLTEPQMQHFIAAQAEISPILARIPPGRDPDQRTMAQLEAIAKKNGFANFEEYDDVESNISLVMSGIDPQTKKFSEPPEAIKAEIARVTADRAIPAAQKRQILQELNEALKSAAPVQFPSNVELVLKYFDKLSELSAGPPAPPPPAPSAAPKAKSKK
jgi:hypothetical protein